ncbi:unnamed protein product [Cunninghamella blakesleeana]
MAENRPEYRNPKIPRSVKVYTIGQESRHLIINNIPAISGEEEIIQDLLNKCWIYGQIKEWRLLEKEKEDKGVHFTNRIYVQYSTIDQSRLAKNKLSGFVFYANLLQASYAPEYDSIDDLRFKFQNRQSTVYRRLQQLAKENYKMNHPHYNMKKRKRSNSSTMTEKEKDEKKDHHPQQVQQQQHAQQLPSLMVSKLPSCNTTTITQSNHDNSHYYHHHHHTVKLTTPSSINQNQRRRI